MKLVKNSDITLTVNGNGVPIFFEPVRFQQTVLCIGRQPKRTDLLNALRCFSPISFGLLSPDVSRK